LKFDWGKKENLKRYGTVDPPAYDLSTIKFNNLNLYVGELDELADV